MNKVKNRITSFLLIIAFAISPQLFAQKNNQQEIHHRAKLFYNDISDLKVLSEAGITVESGKHKLGFFIESDFSVSELEDAKALGFENEILIEDVQQFYVERNKKASENNQNKAANSDCSTGGLLEYETPDNFNLGSMGGFFTYEEIMQELDDMHSLYPNLINARADVSEFETWEGRALQWVRISNNPEVDENKPEILYDAVHHAREPMSVSQLVYYMWYLLENYDTDAEVQGLVNNLEMYFIPVVNPDGYIYNQTTNPNGGGMWRKNRRDHDDGNYGVDNNRNYSYEWGGEGVSFDTDAQTYPGDGGFSEPENQAVKWFCEQHEFKLALNNHSYGNLLLYPFGYDYDQLTEDNEYYMAISELMVSQNGFANILSSGLYPASGDSDDWMYVATDDKPKIFSFTPEIGNGSQGFWPSSNDIIDIAEGMVFLNLTSAHLITDYALASDNSPLLIESLTGNFEYEVVCLGMDVPADFSVEIVPVSSNIINIGAANSHTSMEQLQTETGNISFELNAGIQNGDLIEYQILVDNGEYTSSVNILKYFGASQNIVSEIGDDTDNWENSDWSVTTSTYHSAPSCITDSQFNYQDNENNILEYSENINLADAYFASLSFYAKWEIEDAYDYVTVEVRVNNGGSWIQQCGNYTSPGSGDQLEGQPLYDGLQPDWVLEEINLSDYLGEEIQIRFRLKSDGGLEMDGFYLDDMEVNVGYNTPINIEEANVSGISIIQNSPNPASDYTIISYNLVSKNVAHDLIIRNHLGQEVERVSLESNANEIKIDLSSYAQGIYSYRIENADSKSESKMIVVVK